MNYIYFNITSISSVRRGVKRKIFNFQVRYAIFLAIVLLLKNGSAKDTSRRFIRRELIQIPLQNVPSVIGDVPDVELTNLFPLSLQEEVTQKEYRILGIGQNFGSKDESPLDLLTSPQNLSKINARYPKEIVECAQTAINNAVGEGNSVDFIFLEYDFCQEGLLELGKVLRVRFPAATIVFTHLWSPLSVRFLNNDGESVNLRAWSEILGYERKNVDVMDAFLASNENWQQYYPNQSTCVENLRWKVGASIIMKEKDFKSIPTEINEFKEFVVKRLFLYENDWSGLSSKGLKDCARGLADFMMFVNQSKLDLVNAWPENYLSCST